LECVILIGLPAAGKTTFYRRYFASTHQHVSKDLWPHARHRDRRQEQLLREAFADGRSVVIDNTNPSQRARGPLIAIARAHGARVIAYCFEASTREAVARNAGRVGREKVPNVAIFAAAKQLEPPLLSEGFDRRFSVRVTPHRGFSVREISDADCPSDSSGDR
jgi:predicted kinase